MTNQEEHAWWERPGLQIVEGRLTVSGRDAEATARKHGTPSYTYDLPRVAEQGLALRAALSGAGLRGIVRLALKAQREPTLLRFLRRSVPFVALDVCSPGELDHALAHGWRPDEISYTGTNLSEADLDRILAVDGVRLNVDLLTQLDRVGRRAPGRPIGLRVNPGIGASFGGGQETFYSGSKPTKFGLFPEQLPEALAIARQHRMTIDTVHFHVGDGYLSDALPILEETVARVARMAQLLLDEGCPIQEINTGGGLGVPQTRDDQPLDLDRWAGVLARHLGPLNVAIGTEPGDFLTKEAGVLLAEVVSVEERRDTLFAGLDVGWNAMCEHFVYGSLLPIILCHKADAAGGRAITVAGHINEGNDLVAEDLVLPEIREGDVVAVLGVGSYNASMWSEHCLRPPAGAVFFEDRLALTSADRSL